MERIKRIAAHRTVRFALVGATNTAINFGVLNLSFYFLKQSRIVSSIIATTIAVVVSFVLNRSFVFASHGRPMRQLVLFIVVTVSGVILVQNAVFMLSNTLIAGHDTWLIDAIHSMIGLKVGSSFADINFSNGLGAIAAMIWNYNGYRMFVFKDKRKALDETLAEAA